MTPLTLTASAESVLRARHSIVPSTPDRIYILLRSREIADEVRGYLSWALDVPSQAYDQFFQGWDMDATDVPLDRERLEQALSADLSIGSPPWLLMDDTSALEYGFLQRRQTRSVIRQIILSDRSSRAFRRSVKAHGIDPDGLYYHIRRTEEVDHVSYLEELWNVIGRPRS